MLLLRSEGGRHMCVHMWRGCMGPAGHSGPEHDGHDTHHEACLPVESLKGVGEVVRRAAASSRAPLRCRRGEASEQ